MGLSSIRGLAQVLLIIMTRSPCLVTDMFRICASEQEEAMLKTQLGLLTSGQGGVNLIELDSTTWELR